MKGRQRPFLPRGRADTGETDGQPASLIIRFTVFHTNPHPLLKLFLEELIPERKIADLKYAPQEHVNPFPDNKGIRVDVECTDIDGTRFVVEMQLAHQNFFYERALFNSTFAIQEQMTSGEGSYDSVSCLNPPKSLPLRRRKRSDSKTT